MAGKIVENELAEIKSLVKCYRAAPMSRNKRLNRRDHTSRAVLSVINHCYWFQSNLQSFEYAMQIHWHELRILN